MTFRSRPFAGADDEALMMRMLERAGAMAGATAGAGVLMTIGDLAFWRHQRDAPPLEDTCRLWLGGDGHLAGFAWASPGAIDVALAPDGRRVLGAMMAWAEDFLRSREGGCADVVTAAMDGDCEHETELASRGYRKTDAFHHWYRMRSLSTAVDAPLVPGGFVLRTVADAGAWRAMSELIDRSRASPPFTADGWRALMASPAYVAELDLLAFASDGSAAAHCTAWLDRANRTLLIEPLGCDEPFRRMGLARALVLECLRRGQALGAATALVASDGANVAANAAYEALGFRAGSRKHAWTKRL